MPGDGGRASATIGLLAFVVILALVSHCTNGATVARSSVAESTNRRRRRGDERQAYPDMVNQEGRYTLRRPVASKPSISRISPLPLRVFSVLLSWSA